MLTQHGISFESTTPDSDSRRHFRCLLSIALRNLRKVIAARRQSANSSFLMRVQAIADEGVSADRVRHHLVELYKALNEYSLAQYGTHLTREGFKRLVFQGTGVHV